MKKKNFIVMTLLATLLPVWVQAAPEIEQVSATNAFYQREERTICKGSSTSWRKYKNLKTEGNYFDSVRTDSVYHLHLTVRTPFYYEESLSVCKNELNTFRWHDMTFSKAGTYTRTYADQYGCDSTYVLRLTIANPSPTTTVTSYFCRNQGFEWHGAIFYEQKIMVDSLKNKSGCDSLVFHSFIPRDYNFHTELIQHNQGTSYVWRGRTLTKDGVYHDSLVNRYGCDSIFELRLVTRYILHSNIVRCQGDLVMFHDEVITTNCDRSDTLKTHLGGDSIINYHYSFTKSFYATEEITICANKPQEWEGHYDDNGKAIILKEAGSYFDRKHNTTGCDSIYEIVVTTSPAYERDSFVVACNDSISETNYIQWTDSKGKLWKFWKHNIDTTIVDTLGHTTSEEFQMGGCDSLFRFRVVISDRCSQIEYIPLCENETKWIDGKEYDQPGRYYNKMPSSKGLNLPDSTHNFVLFTATPDTTRDSDEICASKMPYIYHNGQEYTKPESVDDTIHFVNQYGCDSVVLFHLEVIPNPEKHYHFAFCQGEQIDVATPTGKHFTRPGTYADTILVAGDCDSIFYYHIQNKPTYHITDTAIVKRDGIYFWKDHGHPGDLMLKPMQDTVVYDSLKTAEGCDSVYTLVLIKAQSKWIDDGTIYTCQNQPIYWRGRLIDHSGTYSDTLRTIYGMDSIHTVVVVIDPIYSSTVTRYLCPTDTFWLHDKPYTKSGIYIDTAKTSPIGFGCGCDSITYYNIIFSKKPERHYDNVIIPEDSVLLWHGKEYNKPGHYQYTDTNRFGCDSIQFSLNLYIEHSFRDSDSLSVCASELPYKWHGKELKQPGIYYDSLKTTFYLLDSIYYFHLSVCFPKDSTVYETHCDDQLWEIGGTSYTKSSIYTDTLLNSKGCDSIYITHVIQVMPSYRMTRLVELRPGDSCVLGDTVIWTAGAYSRRFQTVNGCDSLITYVVTTCPNASIDTVYRDVCAGNVFYLNGEPITQSGKYPVYGKSRNGCDSIVIFNITFHSTNDDVQVVNICQGDKWTWHGHHNDTVLTKQGVYVDSVPVGFGCFDTYMVKLVYKHTEITDTIITICSDSLPYQYKGQYYASDHIFNDTLQGLTEDDCYRIKRLHYNINYHCSQYDQYRRCTNEVIYVEGLLIDHAGVYSVHRMTELGEDSLYRFVVRDVPLYELKTVLAPACDSLSYLGKTYYARGAGKETFIVDIMHKSMDGCDSLEHVEMTINSSSSEYVELATITDYQTYRFEGHDYSQSGIYPVHFTNQRNCDSTRTLVLTVTETKRLDPVMYSFCKGSPIEVFGKWYQPTKDTLIADTLSIGGQPTIRTAQLIQHYPFTITSFDPQSDQIVCSNSKFDFYVSYSTSDPAALPEFYDVEFLTTDVSLAHTKSSYATNNQTTIPVTMEGDGTYINPGEYFYRIRFYSVSCSSSETTVNGNITVRYPSSIMEANWSNAVMLVNADYNEGHWSFIPPYAWQVFTYDGQDKSSTVVPSDPTQSYLQSDNLVSGDQVIALLYREGYTKPVLSCPFTFVAQPSVEHHPVLVYPTVTSASNGVHVRTNQSGAYRLYNTTGHTYTSGTIVDGDNLVNTPNTCGCYLLKITLLNGEEKLQRIIIY